LNLELQKSHVLAQAQKIKCILAKEDLHENTHTFAYYVIKGELFNNLPRSYKHFKTNGWYVNTKHLLNEFLKYIGNVRFPDATCSIGLNSTLRMNVFE
jgi:hypothetical protein